MQPDAVAAMAVQDQVADRPPVARLVIPSCIGCGSMQLDERCTVCDYERLQLLSAASYDTLLAARQALIAELDALAAPVELLAAAVDQRQDAVSILAAAGELARTALHDLDGDASAVGADAVAQLASEQPTVVWRCRVCGAVDALQECLGICIWRQFEWVPQADLEALADEVQRLLRRERELSRLARAIAFSRPRAGHAQQQLDALRTSAAQLLTTAA